MSTRTMLRKLHRLSEKNKRVQRQIELLRVKLVRSQKRGK